MKQNPPNKPGKGQLRSLAEARMQQGGAAGSLPTDPAGIRRLIHELQVHQIELEMQNEEMQNARDALEKVSEKYTHLYDYAPVAYLTLDRNGAVTECNHAAARLLGKERTRVIGHRLDVHLQDKDVPAYRAYLDRLFQRLPSALCEVTLRRDDPPPFVVQLNGVLSDVDDSCRLALTDVSELKRLEHDRMILGKLESTGTLAGGIAHDYNNLLTIMLLNLDLIQSEGSLAGEVAERLDVIRKTTLQARGLTHQLITLAKGSTLERTPCHLGVLVEESAGVALSGSDIQFVLQQASDLRMARVDSLQISQALQNIMGNAREAMQGGGEIFILAENCTMDSTHPVGLSPGRYVHMQIKDQGCGIPPENLSKVFDPYFSTKERGDVKGMGLGLTIAHSIFNKHGGAITVSSELGVGSVFDLYLPALEEDSANVPGLPSVKPTESAKILVMDDEQWVLDVVGRALTFLGHRVELVAHGQAVVEAYTRAREEGKPFDVVLLDLTVRNGMGGQSAMRELLKINPSVQAILMSGYTHDPVVLHAEEHGFKALLAKPFDVAKLQTTLDQVLHRRS